MIDTWYVPSAQVILSLIFTAFRQDSRFHHPLSADAPRAVGVTQLAGSGLREMRKCCQREGPSQRPCPHAVTLTPARFISYLSYMIVT